jgi:hypothetical protein
MSWVVNGMICLAATLAPLDPAAAAKPGSTSYEVEVQSWRQGHEERLKHAWLEVAGEYSLKPGANSFGSGSRNDIPLPAGSVPEKAGVFEMDGTRVRVKLEPGVVATISGRPVRQAELRPDTLDRDSSGEPDVIRLGRLSLYVMERGGRFKVRLKDPQSEALRTFTGLDWYPVRPEYRILGRFEPYAPPRKLPILDVSGQLKDENCPGRVVFTIAGQEVGLDVLSFSYSGEPEQFFVIFRDGTSGKETYGAGRTLYIEPAEGGRFVLDFNKAYSPACAFTRFAVCALPPKQNWLKVRIEGGEKAYHTDRSAARARSR